MGLAQKRSKVRALSEGRLNFRSEMSAQGSEVDEHWCHGRRLPRVSLFWGCQAGQGLQSSSISELRAPNSEGRPGRPSLLPLSRSRAAPPLPHPPRTELSGAEPLGGAHSCPAAVPNPWALGPTAAPQSSNMTTKSASPSAARFQMWKLVQNNDDCAVKLFDVSKLQMPGATSGDGGKQSSRQHAHTQVLQHHSRNKTRGRPHQRALTMTPSASRRTTCASKIAARAWPPVGVKHALIGIWCLPTRRCRAFSMLPLPYPQPLPCRCRCQVNAMLLRVAAHCTDSSEVNHRRTFDARSPTPQPATYISNNTSLPSFWPGMGAPLNRPTSGTEWCKRDYFLQRAWQRAARDGAK